MMLIRELRDNSLERTYHICESAQQGQSSAHDGVVVSIDEADLAWLYIAPGYEGTEACRRLLALACNLLGTNAWAVLQAGDDQCQALCRELGLHIVESYPNEADEPSGVSVHIAQLGRRDA